MISSLMNGTISIFAPAHLETSPMHPFITVLTVCKVLLSFHLDVNIPSLLSTLRIIAPRSHDLSSYKLSESCPTQFAMHVPGPLKL